MQNKKTIPVEIIAKLKELLSGGSKESDVRRWFRDALGLKKTQGNAVYNETVSSLDKIEQHGIQFISDKYSYNQANDSYVISLKCQSKPLVISGSKHRAICRSYSTWGENLSCDEIVRKYALTPAIFDEYRRIFALTKTTEPLSIEEVLDNSIEDSVSKILEEKRYNIYQAYEKESWKSIQNDAIKWQNFQAKQLDPFTRFIEGWTPPVYKPYNILKEKTKDGYSFIIILNDLHYGGKSNSKTLFRGGEHSTNYVVESIRKYGEQIESDIKNLNLKISSIVLVSLGDLLHTANMFGTTTKGTPLRHDMLGEEMFETAFNSLSEFIYNISKLAPETKVYSFKGNHFGVGDGILFLCLSKYFKDQTNIKFDICNKFAGSFVEKNTFFICSHGANDQYKSKAPGGIKLQSYIQSLIIHAQENLKGIKSRVALFADMHHLSMKEFNDFYYILAPSIVAGDEFADALSLDSKPSQICLLLDETGIKSHLNYYF